MNGPGCNDREIRITGGKDHPTKRIAIARENLGRLGVDPDAFNQPFT